MFITGKSSLELAKEKFNEILQSLKTEEDRANFSTYVTDLVSEGMVPFSPYYGIIYFDILAINYYETPKFNWMFEIVSFTPVFNSSMGSPLMFIITDWLFAGEDEKLNKIEEVIEDLREAIPPNALAPKEKVFFPNLPEVSSIVAFYINKIGFLSNFSVTCSRSVNDIRSF
jgi:hypothetical protein